MNAAIKRVELAAGLVRHGREQIDRKNPKSGRRGSHAADEVAHGHHHENRVYRALCAGHVGLARGRKDHRNSVWGGWGAHRLCRDTRSNVPYGPPIVSGVAARIAASQLRGAKHRNLAGGEVQMKKIAATACFVLALIGPSLAQNTPTAKRHRPTAG